jgi:O-antigen/teichoic acid export membrane protein
MDATTLVEYQEMPSNSDLGAHKIGRDVATLVIGSLLAAVFGALVVFVIPRITRVADFGYWRIFVLYVGYVGFFHLGFGEGALLSWAGKSLGGFHQELRPTVKFLVMQHLILLAPGCLIVWVFLPPNFRFLGIAVLAFALLQNTAVVLQCALQAARKFRPVAVATAAPSGLFLAFACLSALQAKPDYRMLVGCYFLASLLTLGFLWTRIRPFQFASTTSAWTIGRRYIAIGWPITLANTAFGLVQSSDRFVLSSTVPIYDFAQYSLAASTMMVPLTLIAALARVFFPHLAAAEKEQHPEIYGQVSRLIVLAWSALLPYYFLVDLFVHRYLAAYLGILPVTRILLLGVLFLAVIQILHGSVFNLYGKQKHFLLYAIAAVAMSLGLAATAVFFFHSLRLVAAAQVVAVVFWWLFNAWRLRSISGESWRDFASVLFIFVWSATCLHLAFLLSSHCALRTSYYWILTAGPLVFVCRDQIRSIGLLVRDIRPLLVPSSVVGNGTTGN